MSRETTETLAVQSWCGTNDCGQCDVCKLSARCDQLEAVAKAADVELLDLACGWLAYFCEEGEQPDLPVFDAFKCVAEIRAQAAALAPFRAPGEPRET